MLCRYPYIKDRSVTRLETRMSKEKRLDATPFPCGQCLACRINQRRVWTHRLMLERLCHGDSCWVTLTYSDECLPDPPYVSKTAIQKWLKKVRNEAPPFRYFLVGEYGEASWRPHYHVCLFGLQKTLYARLLYDKWGMCEPEGFFISELEEKNIQYTAGYTTAKLTKKAVFKEQGWSPEFMLSSRKDGGIGYPAIVQIANAWKKSKWSDKRIIREINLGKKETSLGRYLTTKLSELLKTPQSQLDQEYWLHQEEIFDKHMKSNALDYYESLTDEDAPKYHRLEKRHRMWKTRSL